MHDYCTRKNTKNFKSLFEFNTFFNEGDQKPFTSSCLCTTVANELNVSHYTIGLMGNFFKAYGAIPIDILCYKLDPLYIFIQI